MYASANEADVGVPMDGCNISVQTEFFFSFSVFVQSYDSIFDITTGYGLGDQGVGV
jgi:hypothetical protein